MPSFTPQAIPSLEEVEAEFWRIVEEGDQQVEVEAGVDLETGFVGSGFPVSSSSNCASPLRVSCPLPHSPLLTTQGPPQGIAAVWYQSHA